MHRFPAAVALASALTALSGVGSAQDGALTLEQALQLARGRAPGIVAARSWVNEARGRLAGASVLLRDNPVFESSAGRRASALGESLDVELSLSQSFELGGRRGARIAGAEAGVSRVEAMSEDATRRILRDVAVAFLRVLHSEEQVRLARAGEVVATEILRIAERRLHTGDIPRLDVNLSRAALSRARSEVRETEARQLATLGELRMHLGVDSDAPLAARGDLKVRRSYTLEDLLRLAPDRADLKALAAERGEADADMRLADGIAWPGLGLGIKYAREEEAHVFLGTLSLSLPIFERGQGLRAESGARSRRLSFASEAGLRIARVQVCAAFDVYLRRAEAVEELERNALPLLDENETLARRSYESGLIGLADLMVVRREIVGIRLEYTDRLLEAAIAGVELEASAGALR